MWRRIVIGFTFCALSCSLAEPVQALASYKKVFDERYIKHSDNEAFKKAFKKRGCNTCHVKKKKRDYVNTYGMKLSEVLAGNAKDRLDAAKESGGLEAKRAENDRLLKELEIALKKVENMKVSGDKTYGELFESHQLPAEDEGVSLRPTAAQQPEKAGQRYTETIPGTDVTFDMVPVPGGRFTMGCTADQPGYRQDESPPFEVTLDPFWMGNCEVTWDEYELWCLGLDQQLRELKQVKHTDRDQIADAITMPTMPYTDMTFDMGKHRFPAICMTQLAAKIYCKWLSAKTGRLYRLPTEAEWEYACRAGTTTAYSFGDNPKQLAEYAWYGDNASDKYQQVGRKKPNPWGLYDMHGNVAEWVLDRYTPGGYPRPAANPVRNPLLKPTSIYPRVIRGGAWNDGPDRLRSAARQGSTSDWKEQDPQIPQSIWYHTDATFVGFRVVRTLDTPTAESANRYEPDSAQRTDMADYAEARGLDYPATNGTE
jgi:formylglycine-generating enzyme required for sulfatase activity